MKNYLIIILIVLTVGIAVFCGDSSKKEKSYTEHLIGALDRADALALDTKIKTIKAALNLYYTDNNGYPETMDMLVPVYLGTQANLLDPWGTQFNIETDEEMNSMLISAGKDKIFGNADDIKRRI